MPEHQTIEFSARGEWRFPAGTVFIKHFEMPPSDTHRARRLETRVLVRDAIGGVYGVTYRWREDNSDADLVEQPTTITVDGLAAGKYYLPSGHDCQTCHTSIAGGVSVIFPSMPTGVEHIEFARFPWLIREVIFPSMPTGVEHTLESTWLATVNT